MVSLTKTVLKRPIAVIVIVAGLIIFGISSVLAMPLQLMPDMNMPMLAVATTMPQTGPEDIDRLVSKEVEDGLSNQSGLDKIISRSMENMSLVILTYDYGTDIDQAYMDIKEALETVKPKLPEDARDPIIWKMDTNATPVMYLSVAGPNGFDIAGFAENVLQPELEKISTISQVELEGGATDYISIEVNPETLSQFGLDISAVSNAIATANFTMPAGTADIGKTKLNLSSKLEYKTPETIRTIPITTATGKTIHVSDVALVRYQVEDPTSITRYKGEENINVNISKVQSASAVTVSKDVHKVLEKMQKQYPDISIDIQYDSSDSITSAIKSIFETMLLGIACTMAVLFLFFGDFKGSLIVACSMPISLLLSFIIMSFMGFSLNMVTMGAMVIAIGMMVDNAIVVIEMCFQKRDQGYNFIDSAFEATKTVFNSVVASTLTTVVVYVPLATMKGLSGQMFGQLGYTIVFAMVASLICAVTVVPLCYSRFKPLEKKESHVNRFLQRFSNRYAAVLVRALRHKLLVAILAIVIFVATIFMTKFLHTELMAATDEGEITVTVNFRPGTRIEFVDAKVAEIEAFIAASPYVDGYSTSASAGSGSANAYIADGIKKPTKEIVDEWLDELKQYEDNCEITVAAGSSMGMTGGGAGNAYQLTFESMDLDQLKGTMTDLEDIAKNIDGVISVSTSYGTSNSKADVVVDPLKAVANNLTPKQVASSVYTAMNGSKAMEITYNGNRYDVKVEYPKGEYETINDIQNLMLVNNKGQKVALQDVAEVVLTDSPETIYKQDKWYYCNLECTYKSDQKFQVEEAVKSAFDEIELPNGVNRRNSTRDEMMADEFKAIGMAIVTAIILIYMVMAIEFENLRYSAMVMFCIPFALIGSIGLLLITNTTISMVSLMGFLMLIGIVVNNGILFVDFTNQLRAEGMHTSDALVATGQSRLRPILMTTLTTILSMVPMAIGLGKNGDQMKGMAMVIIGGLIASTVLTLLLLPTFYMIIHRKPWKGLGKGVDKKAAKKAEKEAEKERYQRQLSHIRAHKQKHQDEKSIKKDPNNTVDKAVSDKNDDIEIIDLSEDKE